MKKIMPFIDVKDKATDVYSQFSFEDFWRYINPEETLVFELRMKKPDKSSVNNEIRELASILKVPYHWTGVFVQTTQQFQQACAYCYQHKLTLYLSINPKRKSIHGGDGKNFPTYNGKMQSDLKITHFLIDFDASDELKEDKTVESGEVCYRVAKKFLNEQPNIKNYCMLCSGNGIQLRVKLDKEILLPAATYDANNQFIITDEWATYSRLLKSALRSILEKYNTPRVLVDLTSLELARVGRSPFSANFKNIDHPKLAGVIEICNDEENAGLYDYILSFYDKVFQVETQRKTISSDVAEEFMFGPDNIQESKLAKMFLEYAPLPGGGRNNILFFQFKMLCQQNGIPLNHPNILAFVRRIERIQKETYPLNPVDRNVQFNPEAVVNYCIEKRIKPTYEVLYRIKNRKVSVADEDLKYKGEIGEEELPDEKNAARRIVADIKKNPINYSSPYWRPMQIQQLMGRIAKTYDVKFVQYLLANNILKDILEKTG